MNEETYESLKELLAVWRNHVPTDIAFDNDNKYKMVENWIDEVEKEYLEE